MKCRLRMLKISVCSLLLVAVVFDVVPHRTASTPLNRVLRSPDTTPESHISNFLHQHRADSRADKPEDHPQSAANDASSTSEPAHTTTHRPHLTTTEPPITQTELLVNLIHNTIQTVRDQFPAIIGAISSPRDPPTTAHTKPEHPKKEHHSSHGHLMHERSTNVTSGENAAESGERPEDNEVGEEEDELLPEEDEEFDESDFKDTHPANLLPAELIRTIVEASGASSARGSAGASAGLVASTSAGASTSSSSGSGRTTRQAEEDEQAAGGSGEFLVGILRTKARALASLIFSPFLSASAFAQRSIAYASSSSSGVASDENRPQTHTRYSDDHHTQHHDDDSHHHGHHRDSHEHGQHTESHGHGHQSNNHGQHSNNHGQNSNHHGHSTETHHESAKNHSSTPATATNEIESANLIFNGYEQDKPNHQLVFRAAPAHITTDELLVQEASSVDEGPLRIVLANGNLDDGGSAARTLVRNTREARTILSEGFGIYILEIFGSIAGLTWGAIHQITHLFEGRDDEVEAYF